MRKIFDEEIKWYNVAQERLDKPMNHFITFYNDKKTGLKVSVNRDNPSGWMGGEL